MSLVKSLRAYLLGKLQPLSAISNLVLTMIVSPYLWEIWFCQSLVVPIPDFLENPRQCPCRQFSFDHYGDHIQTCQCQHGEDDRFPPRTLVMDVTMTHDRYGRTTRIQTELSHTEYPPPVVSMRTLHGCFSYTWHTFTSTFKLSSSAFSS